VAVVTLSMILKTVAHNAVHFPADFFAVLHVHLQPMYPLGPLLTSTLLRISQCKRQNYSNPRTDLDRPGGLQEFEVPRFH